VKTVLAVEQVGEEPKHRAEAARRVKAAVAVDAHDPRLVFVLLGTRFPIPA